MATPRFRIGEPICIVSEFPTSLPTAYRSGKNQFSRYHEDPSHWLEAGKELFCKIPAKKPVFGYACAYDDGATVVHAGAEWSEETKLALFAMICVGLDPYFIRIEDMSPSLYKVVDEENNILEDYRGIRKELSELVEQPTVQP